MENLSENMHVFVLSCLKLYECTKNKHILMYFLVPPFTHYVYIIMVKGLLNVTLLKDFT